MEMNAIFSIGLQSMEELIQLCPVPSQIISPRDSKPITAVVQDVATGLFRLTKNHIRISERQFMNIMSNVTKFTGEMPEAFERIGSAKYWTGRQALSMILPERLNIDMTTDGYNEDKTAAENENFRVVIRNGEILSGAISKDVYQGRTRGVVHSIFNEYGPDETRQLFDNTQKMICDWLVYDGFSTGISDLIIKDKTEEEFRKITHDMKVKVYDVIRSIHEGKFENNSTKNNYELFEETVNNTYLNTAGNKVGNIALSQISDRYNRLINMIKSKSKGNTINVAQMIGCVGQQNVEGRRIPYGFDDRTLPHYTKYDDGPESRGFVENSFIKGLSPQEFFFHAMGGREGLIDTAVQTSETGYIQRKLVKAMEDCKVNYDMTVRNAGGVIIQYLYGEDGMDACKLDSQVIPHIEMDTDRLMATYGLVDGLADYKPFLSPELYTELVKNSTDATTRLTEHLQQVLTDREHVIVKMNRGKMDASIMYPVSLQKLLTTTQNLYAKYGANVPHDLSPIYVLDRVDELCSELSVTKSYPGNMLFQILLRAHLSPKRVIINYRLTKTGFDAVIEQIKYRFFDSLVNPSEMVGVVAAQSIGEISTQLVLNSVAYDTELLLNFNGTLRRVKIGEYIDSQMNRPLKIEDHPNDTKLAWLDEPVTILSCDEDGRVDWKRVEAVTRHPVVNKDGTNTVIKVTTKSGRCVIATKGKSFLKRVDNKIVAVDGEDLCVGDYLPVSTILPIDQKHIIDTLDISKYLPKTKYIYMSEVEKGIKLAKESRYWWSRHHGKDVITPYSRSDAFYDSWISHLGEPKKQEYRENCLYPKRGSVKTHIPEHMDLDLEFGFLIGAYLSEGCTCSSGEKENDEKNEHHVLIANVDPNFNNRLTAIADKLCARYHWDDRYVNGGHSVTCRIHSVILAELMSQMCGNGSPNKRVPAFAFQAPDVFLKGLIDGYFSGDGTVAKTGNTISAYSVSRGLLDDVQQILTRFGIESYISFRNNDKLRAKRPESKILDGWNICMTGRSAIMFAKTFTNTIDYKYANMNNVVQNTSTYGRSNIVPTVVLEEHGEMNNLTYEVIEQMLVNSTNENDKRVLAFILQEDILYDRVENIEEIANPTPYVYDLTVKDTRTFNLHCGLCQNDTFHSAGQSVANKATRGVPRLNELLAVSKKIKTPIMRIYLKPNVHTDKRECLSIMNNIRTVRYKDIITSSKIYFDPEDFNTNISEDRGFIESYRTFMDTTGGQPKTSPWLIRFEFDRDKMQEYKLDMITLHHVLTSFYDATVSCLFSDDNSKQLIMRVRLNLTSGQDTEEKQDDLLTDLKALEHNIIENVVIKGIKYIHRAALEEKKGKLYNTDSKAFEEKREWIIYTEGTNLRDVLVQPIVDAPRTMTNDVNEIYEVLGIEAARQALFNELMDVIDGNNVNFRHIALLVDTMTNRGNILSVNRHGINRGDIGPLAKCSFEETTDKLIKAGVFSEYDRINGVSANVMLGQIAPCGTGDVGVIMDEILVAQMTDPSAQHQRFIIDDETADACAPDVLKMEMPVPTVPDNLMTKTDNDFVLV